MRNVESATGQVDDYGATGWCGFHHRVPGIIHAGVDMLPLLVTLAAAGAVTLAVCLMGSSRRANARSS
jgi:hypothetical protein